jgi:ring-1,2-phenylacetyl-CoA epoxidase subunit PaaC
VSAEASSGQPAGADSASGNAAGREILLALADDEICMGHWYATWMGLAPFLEEDLAATSIGQDELGHARALYALVEPDGDLDALAYGRPASGYRCAWLVEDPCPTWADQFVRHLLYDEAETVRWEALRTSTLPGLAGLSERALGEEAYHTRHAHSLFERLASGGPDARRHLTVALDRLLPLALGLFEPTETEAEAVAGGVMAVPSAQQAGEWRRRLDALTGPVGMRLPWPATSEADDTGDAGAAGAAGVAESPHGGRRGVRSAHFGGLHAEMIRVYALDPRARW